MSTNNVSATVLTDYATGNNYSAVQFQMELVIPYDEAEKYLTLLDNNRWSEVSDLLIQKYPDFKNVITIWLEEAQKRKQNETTRPPSDVSAIYLHAAGNS